ncbi:unnamed protein product, partial [Rotaria sp. Silwood2]
MNSTERIRFHRQRVLDISGRLKLIREVGAATGQIPSIDNMNQNDNLKYANDEQIDDDPMNIYFDEMYEVNNNENEYEDLNNSNSSVEPDSDPDIDFTTDIEDEDDNTNIRLYPNSCITLRQAYTAIKAFIIKCNLAFTQTLYLISLLLFLLPYGHRLTRSGIVRSYKKREQFSYITYCIKCNEEVNAVDGKCSPTCLLYGSQRTADSLTELCICNAFDRIKCVVKRNLSLILEYQKRADHILPNDIVNSALYNNLHQDSKFHRLTLMIHSDGIQMITTKSKKFYVVTGTLLEIPPPLRDYARNKLLLVTYLSENEPTPLLLYDRLCKQINKLISEDFILIDHQKFNIKFQLFKADLPCRSMSI